MIAFDHSIARRGASSAIEHPAGDINVSFEFFPAANDKVAASLCEAATSLAHCGPRFVSVTYGAGGTTQSRSLATVRRLIADTGLSVAAHLTCVDASREDVDQVAATLRDAGVRHIVALRGDGSAPGEPFSPHPQGYRNAADLVAGLRRLADFEISVAAYPEKHPDSVDWAADLDNLKRKFDAGATRALTQFFFSPDSFFRFRDRAAAAGIDAPIIPGILPVTNFAQTRKFAKLCGASIPHWMEQVFEGLDGHPEIRQLVAATVAAELCGQLYAGGVRDFHFYTLNRPEMTKALCHLLGKRAPVELGQAA